MFVLLGPILVVTGILTHTPVNWQSGSAMGLFGALMLFFALRSDKTSPPAANPAPGNVPPEVGG